MITVYECPKCGQVEICKGRIPNKNCYGNKRALTNDTSLEPDWLKHIEHEAITMNRWLYEDDDYICMAEATGLPPLKKFMFVKWLDFSNHHG